MTLLYSDPVFQNHDTGQHPECAERVRRISQHLQETGLDAKCERPQWSAASLENLTRIHGPDYIAQLQSICRAGGGRIEVDTVASRASYDVALQAAGAVVDAVQRVVTGPETRALCLVRPPGHHALPNGPMGFCLFNNIAIGARLATAALELDRVLVVDWDVHHGNGTQDVFWRDERVGFLSIHRWPFYPGSGSEQETGEGPGLGTIRNLPVTMGTSRRWYLERFASELGDFAARMSPDLLLLSAGFDSHRLDPVGSLGLETEDFAELSRIVLDVAAEHCQGRLVSVLEGGYNTDVLPLCVAAHLRCLLEA